MKTMKRVHWIGLLKQKSTLAGLFGLITSICAGFGIVIPAEMQDSLMQLALTLTSVVAIGTQPDGKSAIRK